MGMLIRAILVCALMSIPIDQAWGQSTQYAHDEPLALSSGFMLGFYGGTGVQANGTIQNLAESFPFGVRFGIGYTSMDPGNASDARRIFINNATNGVPEKRGRQWDVRMNLMHAVDVFHLERAFVFAGPRYTRFTGNFKYVGGNEDFDVKSRQWGLGGGLESYFGISPRLDLVMSTGFDWYPKSTLTGHDTSYNPNGDHVNQREDYEYSDADDAINQPKYELRVMLGVQFHY